MPIWDRLSFSGRRRRQERMTDAELDDYRAALERTLTEPARVEATAEFAERIKPEQAQRIARVAAQLLGAAHAEVNILDEDTQRTIAGVDRDGDTEGGTMCREDGWCQNVVAMGQELIVDEANHHRMVRDHDHATSGRVNSYLGVPIVSFGQTVGAVCVFDTRTRTWTESEATKLRMLADVLSEPPKNS